MILTNTDAGKGLKLWYGPEAVKRGEWEESLIFPGFQRVVTPYIHKKDYYSIFKNWIGKIPIFVTMEYRDSEGGRENAIVDEVEKYNDCKDYVYLGHKGINHIVIIQEGQKSYNDLPLRLYEIAEIYSADVLTNDPGLYFSVMCEPDKLDEEAANVYAMIHKSGRLIKYGIKVGTTQDLQYVSADNKKTDAGLILARAKYDLQELQQST